MLLHQRSFIMRLSLVRPLGQISLAALIAAALAVSPANAQSGVAAGKPASLKPVASFAHQVTGVAVAKDGRVFVNFPRWTEDTPVSVAEVKKDGSLVPYPDAGWNSWRNAKQDEMTPNDHFVCVQSVVADARGNLWVVDPGAPAMEQIVKGAPKLVQIDLASNKVVKTIPFDERVAPQGTYLNDIRFSPDGKWGYLTDSGRGAILIVNLESGDIRRVLDGVSSTQAEKGVQVHIDGQVLRRPDGKAPSFAADGLEISADGATLYWQAISSHTLYSIPTAALQDANLQTPQLEGQIKKAGATVIADGLLVSRAGAFFVTSPEDNAVKRRTGEGQLVTVATDKRLRWPDSMAEGPDGEIYVTASRIPDSHMFKADAPIALKTQLFRFTPPR
jgi:sugar lactone lactonase YvrE